MLLSLPSIDKTLFNELSSMLPFEARILAPRTLRFWTAAEVQKEG